MSEEDVAVYWYADRTHQPPFTYSGTTIYDFASRPPVSRGQATTVFVYDAGRYVVARVRLSEHVTFEQRYQVMRDLLSMAEMRWPG